MNSLYRALHKLYNGSQRTGLMSEVTVTQIWLREVERVTNGRMNLDMKFTYGLDKREKSVQSLKAQETGSMEVLESKWARLDKEPDSRRYQDSFREM